MQKFAIYQPTRILFGADMMGEFVKASLPFGKKGLIVTGGSSMERLGYLDEVKNAFAAQGVELIHFKGIEPNPVAQTINKAAKIGQDASVDFVLALGGGSVMDASKAIGGLIHAQEEDIWQYVLGEPKHRKMKGSIPILTIPTTAATASEVTAYAVISNPEVNGKSVLGYEFFKPLVSWMNPAYTSTLGDRTTQDGAADILSHVLENYILGGSGSPIADRYTEMVILTVLETLPKVLKDPENLDLRADLLWASDLALNGYQLAGRIPSQFVLHSMEHAASGFHPELAHGRGLATLYPAYFHWLWEQDRARERFAQLGRRIFGLRAESQEEAGLGFIAHFEQWLKENDLFQSFRDLGFEDAEFRPIAEYAVKVYGDGEKLQALGDLDVDAIESIFRATERQGKVLS